MILVHVADVTYGGAGLLVAGSATAEHSFGGLGMGCSVGAMPATATFAPHLRGGGRAAVSELQSQRQLPSILCYH